MFNFQFSTLQLFLRACGVNFHSILNLQMSIDQWTLKFDWKLKIAKLKIRIQKTLNTYV